MSFHTSIHLSIKIVAFIVFSFLSANICYSSISEESLTSDEKIDLHKKPKNIKKKNDIFRKIPFEERLENFDEKIGENFHSLALAFSKRKIPELAKKNKGQTFERVLIGLAHLLEKKSECVAVLLGEDSLIIGLNEDPTSRALHKKYSKQVIGKLALILNNNKIEGSLGRKALIKFKEIRDLCLLTGRPGRVKAKEKKQAVTKDFDENIHWVKKIIKLKGTKDPQLKKIKEFLLENKVKFLSNYGIHAEMLIVNDLYQRGILGSLKGKAAFLAISKLCCLKCAATLEAVNRVYDCELIANGCHFRLYNWPIAPLIKENKNIFEKLLPENLWKILQNEEEEAEAKVIEKIRIFEKTKNSKTHQPKNQATTTESEKFYDYCAEENENGEKIEKEFFITVKDRKLEK